MIIEETTFSSLLAICCTPIPTTIHRYENIYFGLAHIGQNLYIAIARDGPKEKTPFIEYDIKKKDWNMVDPSKKELSRDPTKVAIPVIEVNELSGETGEKIKSILLRK